MDGAVTEIYGVGSLFLGKTPYIDILESTDKDGNTINSEHIRCRGIPTSCITYKASAASQDKITVLDIYKNLYKGDVTEFDLTNNLTKFVCKNNKDHAISNVTKFTRKAKC